jgi:RNA polymerase sigma-70 factor (ECF subfamily)
VIDRREEDVPVGERAIAGSIASGHEADEGELVRAALAKPEAFDLLYHRYRARIYWYLRTRTATDEDAADLTQQTFLQAWNALPRYQQRGAPFAAWLFRIAHNLSLNAARHQYQMLEWSALPEAIQGRAAFNPEDIALRNETIARLRELIDALDPQKREMLALRFIAGLTIREIAVVLGIGEEALKKRLLRTIRVLKEQFDEQ